MEGTPRCTGPQVPELPGLPAGCHPPPTDYVQIRGNSTPAALRSDARAPATWSLRSNPGGSKRYPCLYKAGKRLVVQAPEVLPGPMAMSCQPPSNTHSGLCSHPSRQTGKEAKREGGEGPEIELKGPSPQTLKRNRGKGWQARPKITPHCQDLPQARSFSCFVGTAVSKPGPQGPGPSQRQGQEQAELGQGPSPPPAARCCLQGTPAVAARQ